MYYASIYTLLWAWAAYQISWVNALTNDSWINQLIILMTMCTALVWFSCVDYFINNFLSHKHWNAFKYWIIKYEGKIRFKSFLLSFIRFLKLHLTCLLSFDWNECFLIQVTDLLLMIKAESVGWHPPPSLWLCYAHCLHSSSCSNTGPFTDTPPHWATRKAWRAEPHDPWENKHVCYGDCIGKQRWRFDDHTPSDLN